MYLAGLSADIVSYNSVINAWAQAAAPAKAEEWLLKMCSAGVSADIAS